jgi:competence protein ComEC
LGLWSVVCSAMDDIKRKLALIDKQLSGGFVNSYHRVISTSPLVFAAVGLILGILIQNTFFESRATSHGSQFIWLILLIVTAVSAVLLFVNQRKVELDSYATVLLSACALIGFACLGAIRLNSFQQLSPDNICNLVDDERKLATVRGLVVTDPYVNRNENWKFARFEFTDPDTSFYLTLGEIQTVDSWSKVSGTIRVQVAEPVLDLKAGDYIQAYCWLDRFEPPTNPGQFDTAKYMARKNVFIAASIPSRKAIEVLQNSSAGFFAKIKRKAREVAVQSLLGSTYPQDESECLLQALVLGYKAEMDTATFEAFRKTGLLHFVCLSGMNFGIFVGMIWWLCKTAGLTRKTQAAVCIIAAAMFVLVVPSNPPAFRAAIICIVFCASYFFRRQPSHFNSLALAAVILLMIKPTDLFDVSWQLSFASVLGILLFAKPAEEFIYEKLTVLFENPLNGKPRPYFRIVSKVASPVIAVFAVSFVAWLTSAGILLYNFYTIQPLTTIWTVVASPFIAVISFAGYLKLLIGLVLPTAASILDVIIKPLSSWLIWVVKYIAQRDFSQMLVGRVSLVMIILYYAFLLIIFFANFHRPLTKKIICVATLLVMVVFLGVTKWQRTHRDNLVLTCLDVGHGQAILAQLPGKANVLFDVGSLNRNDIGKRIVAPFLDYSGIGKIDAVIISHDEIDHINGIPEIIEHCDVNDVYADEVFVDKARKGGAAKFLKEQLPEKNPNFHPLNTNLNLDSPANIKILWPDKQISMSGKLSDNNKSTVCLIEFADKKILLCSDIEKLAQRELLRLYPQLKADIVVVPHHGSAATTDPDFLDANVLLCSCGRSQYEKQQVIESKNNSRIFYTAKDGAIAFRISRDGTIVSKGANE